MRLRLASVVVLLLLISVSQLSAQAVPDTAPVTTIKVESQLVLVPVLVKGKHGEHVAGLGREAFKVEEQGKPRTIATFEEVKPGAAGATLPGGPRLQGHSNFNPENATRGHMTIVVLDLLNSPYLYLGDGKKKLVEEISRAIPAHETTVVLGLGSHGLRQLYAPTADTDGLLASLRGLGGPPVPSTAGASDVDTLANAEFSGLAAISDVPANTGSRQGFPTSGTAQMNAAWTTLDAMTQIARAYAPVAGRKTLIWASEGVSQNLDYSKTFTFKIDDTLQELNGADIAVYSLDVSGLVIHPGISPGFRERQRSLQRFADATGGIWCTGHAIDLEGCLAHAFEDAGSYYILGYYLPEDDQKPGWRKLKVKVELPAVKVRAREGFYVSAGADEKADERQRELLEALQSPVEYTAVAMNVREVPALTPAKTGKSRHEFVIGVLGDSIDVNEKRENAVNVSVVAIAFGKDEKEQARIDHLMKANIPQEKMAGFRKAGLSTQQGLELAPGRYAIHFAARDNLTGRIGTVIYPLLVK